MLLIALLLLPLIGAILAASGGGDSRSALRLGLVCSGVMTILGMSLLWVSPEPVNEPWFHLWGTKATLAFHVAVDGLSSWLIALIVVLTPLALLASRAAAREHMQTFVVSVLALEALMIGSVMARDLVLFYVCYEGMLIPMLVLIALFGGPDRKAASTRFFLYTMLGSVPMLVAIWWLATTLGTTDLDAIIAGLSSVDGQQRFWLFLAFLLAFAVKVPLIPLHSWQAMTYAETPGGVAALLAGAMAKVGIYGVIRFVLPMFPEECSEYANVIITLALVGTVGGALIAIVQDDAKRMVAFSSLSHLGLVIAGIFTFETAAMHGAVVLMVAHGLSIAAIFMLIGFAQARTGLQGVGDFGKLAEHMPCFAILMVVAALATAGLPGTVNFVGEFLLMYGLFKDQGLLVATLAGLSVILTAVYLLILLKSWLFGEREPASDRPLPDLSFAEAAAVVPLLIAAFVLGFWATPITATGGAAADAAAKSARIVEATPAPTPTPDSAPIPVSGPSSTKAH